MKAGEKTVEAIKKEFESYAKAEDFSAFQKAQNEEVEALKKQLSEAKTQLQEVQETFQAALKEIKENLVSEFNLEEKNPNDTKKSVLDQPKAAEPQLYAALDKIKQQTSNQ